MKDLVATFKALADPVRLRIVLLLRRRDLCVCELTAVLGMEQSRISHQLKILRRAGLVEDVRDGKWIIYRLPGPVRRRLGPLLGRRGWAESEGKGAAALDLKKLGPCLLESPRRRRAVRAGRARRSGPSSRN
jgi:DNA-binding transcriptional ArsR family regulator